MNLKLKILILAFGLSGCAAVGPNYKKPEIPLPGNFQTHSGELSPDKRFELTRWWTVFNDPLLNSLINQAVQSNPDLRLAEIRIREVRASFGLIDAERYPKVNASASYTHNRQSENTSQGKRALNSGEIESNLYQLGFDASWEIDLFGSVQRSLEEAEAQIDSTVEAKQMVLVTLLGDVAKNYIEFRGIQRQLNITRGNLKSQQETLEITNAKYQAGLRSFFDVTRAGAQVALTRSQLPLLEKNLKISAHRISVLLGKAPPALWEELKNEGKFPAVSPEIMAGIPSDLLKRRPDIRRAEREMASAAARIGIATANLFPRFSLTGSFGFQGNELGNTISTSGGFWSFGPSLRWPLFDGGKIRAGIKVQDERYASSVIRYEQTILTALEDVENALVSWAQEQERFNSLTEAVKANRQSIVIAKELYNKGLTDFLNVLEVERSLLDSESLLAQSEVVLSSSLVALYKALGGGWGTDLNIQNLSSD